MIYLTNINLNQNELQNAVLQPLAVAPANPKLGQIYTDSSSSKIKWYNGTEWKTVGVVVEHSEVNGNIKVDGVEIYNNIISDLGSESYLINGDLSNSYVKNVTFKNNVLYHKTKNDNVSLISFALVLYTANSFLALQNVINCQVVDPLLNVDFSLAENSPCVDAGLAYSNKAYDFNGQTRVSNGKIDIGAIEKILTEDVIKAFYYNSDRIVKIYFGENPIAKLN